MIDTIVLADDSKTARMVIKRCLQIAGCMETTFFEAEDGYIALDLAKKHDADLIVTDYNMANMDGMALLKRLKASPRLHDIPVVVVTSSKNDAMEKVLLEMGALAVFSKPVSPAVFSDLIENLLDEEGDEE